MFKKNVKNVCWLHTAYVFYQTVRDCVTRQNDCKRSKQKRHLHLFPAFGPVAIMAMNILRALPQAKNGSVLIIEIKDRHLKMIRAITASKTTATHTEVVFFDHWIVQYGIPEHLLTEIRDQFVSTLLTRLCELLGMKHLTGTEYHPQKNGHFDRYHSTIVAQIHHYFAKHQDSQDVAVQPLTYAYNSQVYQGTGVSPFSLILLTYPP